MSPPAAGFTFDPVDAFVLDDFFGLGDFGASLVLSFVFGSLFALAPVNGFLPTDNFAFAFVAAVDAALFFGSAADVESAGNCLLAATGDFAIVFVLAVAMFNVEASLASVSTALPSTDGLATFASFAGRKIQTNGRSWVTQQIRYGQIQLWRPINHAGTGELNIKINWEERIHT